MNTDPGHPPALAESNIAEDRRVMLTGSAFNQTWLVPYINGPMQWFVASKLPLQDYRGRCIGVCGVVYPIATPKERLARFQRPALAVHFLEENFRENVQMSELAACCGPSSTHVHRLFQRLLRMSPNEYSMALMLQEARRLLATTDDTLSDVTPAQCGKTFQ